MSKSRITVAADVAGKIMVSASGDAADRLAMAGAAAVAFIKALRPLYTVQLTAIDPRVWYSTRSFDASRETGDHQYAPQQRLNHSVSASPAKANSPPRGFRR